MQKYYKMLKGKIQLQPELKQDNSTIIIMKYKYS